MVKKKFNAVYELNKAIKNGFDVARKSDTDKLIGRREFKNALARISLLEKKVGVKSGK
ncbi:MAG: hypothetical protein UU83_C0047G0008 [Candidatus Jorgensenbacteria bacterium GW2011_GWF2_41_8]|uniref:Uncharacterized protein n=1 Tax=Candidatus Jorgensenbacteria bacterium GW2011_GWF2_41_8 TaxID=1618667 RepID=A0A0G0XGM1_9BACT|nr:MAG: hypothetical protein UU83_C0047G0008 [Candidatus Jorgensenbacteria bacterium GW2011_GWF2_41_8]